MQFTLDAGELVDLLDEVDGQPDGAALVGHAAGDGLPDPPGRVRRELEALGVVELLHRPDQAEVALLDQVEQRHPASGVALGQRHDEPQVRLEQVSAGRRPSRTIVARSRFLSAVRRFPVSSTCCGVQPRLDPLGQLDLFLGGQQRGAADPVQVDANQIGGGLWASRSESAARTSSGAGACHDVPPRSVVSHREQRNR